METIVSCALPEKSTLDFLEIYILTNKGVIHIFCIFEKIDPTVEKTTLNLVLLIHVVVNRRKMQQFFVPL